MCRSQPGGGGKLEVLPGRTVEQGFVCPSRTTFLQQRHMASHLFSMCTHVNPEPRFLKSHSPGQEALSRYQGQRFTQGNEGVQTENTASSYPECSRGERKAERSLSKKEHTREESVLHSLLMDWSKMVIFQVSSGLDNGAFFFLSCSDGYLWKRTSRH